MAKTKTAATKTKRARTSTKTTGKRPAGKTARADVPTLPRSARQVALGIWARMKKNPAFYEDIVRELAKMTGRGESSTRTATVMPRRNAPEAHEATH